MANLLSSLDVTKTIAEIAAYFSAAAFVTVQGGWTN
jgi:hypothetical protein